MFLLLVRKLFRARRNATIRYLGEKTLIVLLQGWGEPGWRELLQPPQGPGGGQHNATLQQRHHFMNLNTLNGQTAPQVLYGRLFLALGLTWTLEPIMEILRRWRVSTGD